MKDFEIKEYFKAYITHLKDSQQTAAGSETIQFKSFWSYIS